MFEVEFSGDQIGKLLTVWKLLLSASVEVEKKKVESKGHQKEKDAKERERVEKRGWLQHYDLQACKLEIT